MLIETVLCAYLSAVSVYTLVFSAAGRVHKAKPKPLLQTQKHSFAILIPAYREDAVIVPVVEDALKQNYPSAKFEVIVIADSLQPGTLEKLARLNIQVIEVQFENSTKAKALQAGLAALDTMPDIVVVLDADNLMKPGFLHQINSEYKRGSQAIQARRTAKNLNTSFAVLDAYSEAVNNHIFRKGSQSLGLSSPLAGSGMAFSYPLLKDTLQGIQAVGGFDRELQVKIVAQGYQIRYLHEAVVLDEKVTQAEVFGNQRRRWLSSQFLYFRKFFRKGCRALWQGNLDLFHITIVQNIQLPRMINLGLLVMLGAGAAFFPGQMYLPAGVWSTLLSAQVVAMLLAVPLTFYDKKFLRALASVPKAFLVMCRSLFSIRGANRKFIHTPHTT